MSARQAERLRVLVVRTVVVGILVVGVVALHDASQKAAVEAATADPTGTQREAKAPEGQGLRVFVCGPDGKPFPQARVLVNMRKAPQGEDGTFFVPHEQLERQGPTLILMVQGELAGKPLSCARFIDYVTGKENITVRLWQSGSITGRVLSPHAAPLDGAQVSALMDVGGLTCHGTMPVGEPAVTDTTGQFTLRDLYPDTRYRLRVTCPRRERKLTDWIAVGSRELGDRLQVVLRDAPGSVAGRVVDGKGSPVANSRVILGHPCIPDAVAVTDAEGKFRIEDLVPGEEVTLCIGWNFQKTKVGTEDLVLVARDRQP
jgi:hypothetical protein